MLVERSLTEQIIGLAIEVHRHTGRGLLESVYQRCMCFELEHAGLPFEREVRIPVTYKGVILDQGFRADTVVDHKVIVEIKAIATILPAHESQLLTYRRMSGVRVGLLLNFNASRLTDGLKRLVV